MRSLFPSLALLSILACSTPTAPIVARHEMVSALEVLMTNAEVLAAYDANQSIKSTRVFGPDVPPVKEHGGQTLAFEALRGLIALGITVDQYNAMSQADWDVQVSAAANRMKAYDRPGFNALTQREWDAAASIGGNYFEHTYDFIIAGSTKLEWVEFTKNGPLTKFRFPNG
jgi:hypothetical protein